MAWVNTNTILRDLCFAQGGGDVPEELKGVVAGEKPPSVNYTEETEEEFFENITGCGNTKPNLHLIKQLLHLTKDNDDIDNESSICSSLMISKLDSPIEKSTPQIKTTSNHKMKKTRNAVVQSFLPEQDEKQTHLKTPAFYLNDIKTKHECNENEMLNTNTSEDKIEQTKVKSLPLLDKFMFKRKSVSPVTKVETVKPLIKKKENNPTPQCKAYVPSSFASTYYQKCVERSKMRENTKTDIWAEAEKIMKKIDETRKKESEAADPKATLMEGCTTAETENIQPADIVQSGYPTLNETNFSDKNFDEVRLPLHRHLLKEPCIVCERMTVKHTDDVCDTHIQLTPTEL